jgi:hypothetical protein
MFVNDVNTSAHHRLEQIMHTLKHVHDTDINFNESTVEEITALQETSTILKNSIVSEGAFNSYHSDPNYTKHMLIVEAARLYLTEIAPKRKRKAVKEGAELDSLMKKYGVDAEDEMDEMFYYPDNRSRSEKNRAANRSQDTLGMRRPGTLADPRAKDEYSDVVKGQTRRGTFSGDDIVEPGNKYSIRGPKGVLPEEMTDEGNEFSGELSKAREAGKPTFTVGNKTYKVKEDLKSGTFKPKPGTWLYDPADPDAEYELDPTPHTYAGAKGTDDALARYRKVAKTKAAGTPTAGYEPKAQAAGTPTAGYEPKAKPDTGASFAAAFGKARKAAGGGQGVFTWQGKKYQTNIKGEPKLPINQLKPVQISESHMQSHDYQASMARSELYRNVKYGLDMLKMIRPEDDIEPWIAACLTKDAMYLDKIYHYMDYYLKFEPNELQGSTRQPDFDSINEDAELGETSGSTARQNLVEIIEYSIKLFHMIQPGDHLEGWVAMMLTKASEGISSSKHYLDYKHFEQHAGDNFNLDESKSSSKSEPGKNDFKLVAGLISQHPDPLARYHMAKHHSEVFSKHSPKFNKGRFFAAAKAGEPPPVASKDLANYGLPTKNTIKETTVQAEQDLQQAQTLIAAKSISDDLQTMAEKVARMGVDDLMPLVDTMKTQFGPEAADGYNEVMKSQLESLLKATQEAKDQSDDAVLALQGGQIPGQASDIETAEPTGDMNTAGEPEDQDEPTRDGFSTTAAAAGGNEPLGRAKKPAPAPEDELTEAWGTKMHTAAKDKGKWDGYTIADLKAKKAKLMKKEHRSAAEQKTVKQIDFAIRAKQRGTGKWGEIKEGTLSNILSGLADLGLSSIQSLGQSQSGKDTPLGKALAAAAAKGDQTAAHELEQLDTYIEAGDWNKISALKDSYLSGTSDAAGMNEAKKAKPDFLDVDKDGNKTEPMKKAIKDKAAKQSGKKMAEAKKPSRSPYAIGMWQAKKEAGMDPDKPAKDLPKKLVTRAHEIGKSIEGTNESLANIGKLITRAANGRMSLIKQLSEHRDGFAKLLVENRVQDPLKSGQGIEGDRLQARIGKLDKIIEGLKTRRADLELGSEIALQEAVDAERKAYRFAQAKAAAPWGVMFTDERGAKDYKFFEDQKARDYWVQFNEGKASTLINPEHFDIALAK